MFATRPVTPSDFETIAGIIDSSYRRHDPEGSMPGRHPTALNGPPFSWWGDPALSWWIASLEGRPSAFAMWRHQERDAHLHSFFVADEVNVAASVARSFGSIFPRRAQRTQPSIRSPSMSDGKQNGPSVSMRATVTSCATRTPSPATSDPGWVIGSGRMSALGGRRMASSCFIGHIYVRTRRRRCYPLTSGCSH